MEAMLEPMKQPEEKVLELIFLEEENTIRANDLQGFLSYFNMYYMKLKNEYNLDEININDLINQKEQFTSNFYFSRSDYLNYSRRIYTDNNNLLIFELEKHSPLKIVFGGSIVAVLILSGGTVEIDVHNGVFKANISQSIGKSLQDLKEAIKD